MEFQTQYRKIISSAKNEMQIQLYRVFFLDLTFWLSDGKQFHARTGKRPIKNLSRILYSGLISYSKVLWQNAKSGLSGTVSGILFLFCLLWMLYSLSWNPFQQIQVIKNMAVTRSKYVYIWFDLTSHMFCCVLGEAWLRSTITFVNIVLRQLNKMSELQKFQNFHMMCDIPFMSQAIDFYGENNPKHCEMTGNLTLIFIFR